MVGIYATNSTLELGVSTYFSLNLKMLWFCAGSKNEGRTWYTGLAGEANLCQPSGGSSSTMPSRAGDFTDEGAELRSACCKVAGSSEERDTCFNEM